VITARKGLAPEVADSPAPWPMSVKVLMARVVRSVRSGAG
jgi:hypothetical protein